MSIQSNFPNLKPSLLLDFANTKQLDNRVTFTRSTPAVYYDGKTTAMAEQNLLQQSQTFDNAYWAKWNSSITANSGSAPDGTTTADKIVENTATTLHGPYVGLGSIGVVGQSWTLSVYAKAAGRNFIIVSPNDGAQRFCWFDLSTGTVGTNNSGGTATITSVGSGWYRCSVTRVITGASLQPEFYTASANGTSTYTGDGTSGVEVWGAQLEQRSSATAYTPTTTQAITNYIPVLLTAGGNQPRFDCNPTTGESLGLLIEEQRTNLLTYSAEFDNAYWSKASVTLNANSAVAPNGTLTADTLIATTATADHDLYPYANLSATSYTLSIYAKYAGANLALSASPTGTPWVGCIFDLQNGVAKTPQGSGLTCTAAIQSVGNGWYRCSITYTATAANWYQIIATTNNVNATMGTYGFISYAGDGWSGVQIWGAQLEAGSFATSYIATTSASATRTLDSASMTGTNFSSWFNNGQGTFYAEQYITNVTAGSANNQVAASLYKDSNNFIGMGQGVGDGGGTGQKSAAWVQNNNSTQFFAVTGNFITVGLTLKNAVAYETNNFAYSANTQTLITDSAGVVPSVTTLGIGFYPLASYYYANNPIRKIAYYPIRVTNAQLQALTS